MQPDSRWSDPRRCDIAFVITIPFDPNIHIGPLTIAWHGIFTAVGILFGVWLPLRLVRGRFTEEDATSVATWGVVFGIIGARLVHVIDAWQYYLANPLQILLDLDRWDRGLGRRHLRRARRTDRRGSAKASDRLRS